MAFGRLVLLAVLALADDAGEAAVRSEGACASPEPDACIGRPESRFTLAFGSCHHQAKPAPTLLAAAASAPDVFVFLGDNLYNDVDRWGMPCEPLRCAGRLRTLTSPLLLGLFKLLPLALKRIVYRAFATRLAGGTLSPPSLEGDGAALAAHYAALGAKAEVIALRAAVPLILATWVRGARLSARARSSAPRDAGPSVRRSAAAGARRRPRMPLLPRRQRFASGGCQGTSHNRFP